MRDPIPYGRHQISEDDIKEVVRVLKSDFITQGPEIQKFEEAFASYVGSTYAVAVANGTAALHIAVQALETGVGDQVITTPISFAASANCARYLGAEVLFADIDPETYLIDLGEVEKILQKQPEGKVRGIIPVDFAGRAVHMEALRKLADKYNFWILEDACHAPGAYITDSKARKTFCGDCSYADASVFSFHPVKHIAAGEGGMITTNSESLYGKLLQLRTHGITKDKSLLEKKDGPWYYEMQMLGYNYRMTDMQAALGRSQLERAGEGLIRRREIASKYDTAFRNKTYIKGHSGYHENHAYHLYIIEVDRRSELYKHLVRNQIYAQVHYIPIHLMPYYRQFGWKEGNLPHAEAYYSGCLSLPMFPALTDAEQQYVIDTIEDFYNHVND